MTICTDRLREIKSEWRGHEIDAALDELIARREADRWHPASEPPDTDRRVLVEYESGLLAIGQYLREPDFEGWYVVNEPFNGVVERWRELPEAT